ncbi:hypothetical protein WH243_07110 [Acinetobacter sp. MYb177]|uniref:hypothetical protein n=1 Tax=unclassified Acinetobacter TaxID=196816 RepID=UPI0030A4110C
MKILTLKKVTEILFMLIFILSFTKVFLFSLVKFNFLGLSVGGNSDANYYNDYALGYVSEAVNIWPILLNKLNFLGFYDRDIISFLLFFLCSVLIPFLTCYLANLNFRSNQKEYLLMFLISSIYPTLFFYSLDIYRDVFMVFIFLLACVFVKLSLSSDDILISFFYFSICILFGFFLYELREYLGYAFLCALLLFRLKLTRIRVIVFSLAYVLILFLLNYAGYLKSLTDYRLGFEDYSGGSTLGLDFSNPVMFIPNFLLSIFGQLFGLYFTNPISYFLFAVETLPFIYMFVYVLRNISYSDSYIRFLLIFFVLYASVWLIGNDNLGTAVRLRMYNYFSIYICFFCIMVAKNKHVSRLKEVVEK